MRIERRRAVRANDLKILEPVVGCDAVDVVQDQSHLPAMPVLALTAKLAGSSLEPFVVEAPLEMVARVRRVLDENRREWGRVRSPLTPLRPVRVEMLDRDAVALDQLLERLVIPACGPQPQDPQRLGHAVGTLHGRSNLLFGMPRRSWHTRTLVRAADGNIADLLGFRAVRIDTGEPG